MAKSTDAAFARATNAKVMNRADLTRRLVTKLKSGEAVVGGIGNTNFDLWAAGQRPQNFYMLGSMGLAFPIALGVALAQPKRRVIALEGDGSCSCSSVASHYCQPVPKNLASWSGTTAAIRSLAASRRRQLPRPISSLLRGVRDQQQRTGPRMRSISSG